MPEPLPCELCAAVSFEVHDCALQRLVRPDQRRQIWWNKTFCVVPTIGPMCRGYVLLVPYDHTLALGRLSDASLAHVEVGIFLLRQRLQAAYQRPMLAFEYGLNLAAGRRIEHAHLHAIPTSANHVLKSVSAQLPGYRIPDLASLPRTDESSYILIIDQTEQKWVFPVANHATPRIRLREILAESLPSSRAWDWEREPGSDLIRATLDDLRGWAAHVTRAKAQAACVPQMPGSVGRGAGRSGR